MSDFHPRLDPTLIVGGNQSSELDPGGPQHSCPGSIEEFDIGLLDTIRELGKMVKKLILCIMIHGTVQTWESREWDRKSGVVTVDGL